MNDYFSKELEVMKKNIAEILQMKNPIENHFGTDDQSEDRMSGVKKKNAVIKITSSVILKNNKK